MGYVVVIVISEHKSLKLWSLLVEMLSRDRTTLMSPLLQVMVGAIRQQSIIWPMLIQIYVAIWYHQATILGLVPARSCPL